jgi:hypothetical protein
MKNIHESISKLLSNKLARHKTSTFNKTTCIEIYQDIFESFVDIFTESKIEISNEAMNLLSQMYYDAVTINNNQELDPSIFEKRASVKNIDTKELAMLGTMFNGTPFSEPFVYEVKRRS